MTAQSKPSSFASFPVRKAAGVPGRYCLTKEIKDNYGTLHRISPHQPGRHGGPGVGTAGLCGGGRRCLCGPPQFRHRHHQPPAGSRGLQGGRAGPAPLHRLRGLQAVRKAEVRLLHRRRQRRQHGQPLLGRQDPSRRGRVLSRRQGRRTARPQRHRLHQTCKAGLPRSARHSGRPRGLAAPIRPLRLLAGHRPAQHRRGLGCGHHQLRHGRAPDRGDRPPSGGRRAGGEHHRRGWYLLHDRLRPPARAVCGVCWLQEGGLR